MNPQTQKTQQEKAVFYYHRGLFDDALTTLSDKSDICRWLYEAKAANVNHKDHDKWRKAVKNYFEILTNEK